jgi:hypothetical protein
MKKEAEDSLLVALLKLPFRYLWSRLHGIKENN